MQRRLSSILSKLGQVGTTTDPPSPPPPPPSPPSFLSPPVLGWKTTFWPARKTCPTKPRSPLQWHLHQLWVPHLSRRLQGQCRVQYQLEPRGWNALPLQCPEMPKDSAGRSGWETTNRGRRKQRLLRTLRCCGKWWIGLRAPEGAREYSGVY